MNVRHIFFIFLILIGNIVFSVYVFSNGFLIRRVSLNNTNEKSFSNLKQFNKTVLMFVDALRFDFIFSKNENVEASLFGLSTIENLLKNERSNAKLYKFIADPPTTTMQRI